MGKTPEIKISAAAAKALDALLAAADDYAFLGSMHPETQDEVKERYHRSVHAVRKIINRLETR
ncbi:MAG: hypothetical protein WC829_06970 [Hyphomicrobium sp.]|jgi:hypothetical protein